MATARTWDTITSIERAFFLSSVEMDILPGVFGDLTPAEHELPLAELAEILMPLVADGLIELRRYERWISPNGQDGLTPGEAVPAEELAALLADPSTWEYPDDPSWVGALTLTVTQAGKTSHTPPDQRERACARPGGGVPVSHTYRGARGADGVAGSEAPTGTAVSGAAGW